MIAFGTAKRNGEVVETTDCFGVVVHHLSQLRKQQNPQDHWSKIRDPGTKKCGDVDVSKNSVSKKVRDKLNVRSSYKIIQVPFLHVK